MLDRRLVPLRNKENWFLNFDLKLWREIRHKRISFRSLDLLLSWYTNIESSRVYERRQRHAFILYLIIATTKKFETWNNKLISFSPISAKFQVENQFFSSSWGNHSLLFKNTVKMQYLLSNKLLARTLFRVFIAHKGLRDAHSPD